MKMLKILMAMLVLRIFIWVMKTKPIVNAQEGQKMADQKDIPKPPQMLWLDPAFFPQGLGRMEIDARREVFSLHDLPPAKDKFLIFNRNYWFNA